MKSFTVISISSLLVILFSSCGGGGGGAPPPPDNNALLSGDYRIHKVEYEWFSFIAEQFDGTADGQGTLNAVGENITYSVAADRTISISLPSNPTAEAEYGIVSSDGNLAIITDAQLVDPNDQRDVETLFLVKKSTAMTAGKVAGDYIISQVGQNSSGLYTSRVLIVLNDVGTGTWEILNHSQGGIGVNGTLTFTVAADGTFTVTMLSGSNNNPVSGMISPAADVFVMTDMDDIDAESDLYFAVGVRMSSTAPTLAGTFQVHFIGYDFLNSNPDIGPQFAARWSAVENTTKLEFDATCLIDSRGIPAGSKAIIEHTPVTPTGVFVAEVTDHSILSPDGRFFALVETDTTDGEIKLGLAIR